jgi:hypothetical protein
MPIEFGLSFHHARQLVVGRIRERGSHELCDSACHPQKSARPLAF